MGIFEKRDRLNQFVANTAIEGISYTEAELELFAQLDTEDLTPDQRIARINAFCDGDYVTPKAA